MPCEDLYTEYPILKIKQLKVLEQVQNKLLKASGKLQQNYSLRTKKQDKTFIYRSIQVYNTMSNTLFEGSEKVVL